MRLLALAPFFGLLAAQDSTPLELDEVLYLKKMGKSEEEILRAVESRGVAIVLDEATSARLRDAGFGTGFVDGLRRILLVAEVLAWHRSGVAEEAIVSKLRETGAIFQLTVEELLRLRRSGISEAVVHTLQGTVSQQIIKGYRRFEHPGGLYTAQVPEGWNTVREVLESGVGYGFTPETGRVRMEDVQHGVSTFSFGVGSGSPHAYLPLEEANERFVQGRLRELTDRDKKRPEGERHEARCGEKVRTRLGAVPAMRNTVYGKFQEKAVQEWLFYAYQDGIVYVLSFVAPEADFSQKMAEFQRILSTFDPTPERFARMRKPTASAVAVVEQYKESVVQVLVEFREKGQPVTIIGSGFFVRRDGYVLTNWHVVTAGGKYAKPERIMVRWDSTLKRDLLEATLIGAAYSSYPQVDVALLRVPGENFRPFPLTRTTPLGKYIKEQDRVLALGYPQITNAYDPLSPLTLTTTEGTISRFMLRQDGSTNYLWVTASIQGGNSGGPLFDLETHSVIGLNTRTALDPDALKKGVETTASAYTGVIPIDAAVDHFPEILSYPLNVEDTFTADEFVALGVQYLNQGMLEPAFRQFRKALDRKPHHVRASAQMGRGYLQARDITEAVRYSNQALALDPNNALALVTLANAHAERSKVKALEYLDRALRAEPDRVDALLLRAGLHRETGDFDAALEDARRATTLSEGWSTDALRSLGETYFRMQKYEEGKREFEKAFQTNPQDTTAFLGVARYYDLVGKTERAALEYERAVEKFSDDPAVAQSAADYFLDSARRYSKDRKILESDRAYLKAYECYERGTKSYQKRKQEPPLAFLLNHGWAATQGPRRLVQAEDLYGLATFHLIWVRQREDGSLSRWNDPQLQEVYFKLASLYVVQKFNLGAARGLLMFAIDLDPQTELAKEGRALLNVVKEGPLSNEEFCNLVGWSEDRRMCHSALVADVVTKMKLDWEVTHEYLKRVRGCHPLILNALTAHLK